jgi:Tat protein secretion system quality control protein TatD with DNase activity
MPPIYDTHAHLDYPDFAEISQSSPGRKRRHRQNHQHRDDRERHRAIKLAEQFPNVFAVVGWHPSYAEKAPMDLRPSRYCPAPEGRALGETV